jgi:hypothetical protein
MHIMETLEQKMDKMELKFQHLELIIMRKSMKKEHEEKCTTSHIIRN